MSARLTLDKNESRLVGVLLRHRKYSPAGMRWDDLVLILEAIGVPDPRLNAHEFVWGLVDKTRSWFEYVPYHSLCLRASHVAEVEQRLAESAGET
jgi:hypothetical protein